MAWYASAALLAAGSAWALVAAVGMSAVWAAPVAAAGGALVAALTLAHMAHMAPHWHAVEALPVHEPEPAPLSLAGGVSRPLFMELAQREWARARRHGSGAALLIVHIDRFARLAQARGPQAIESVLAAMLKDTAPTLRGADALTVYSESEIAVFLAPADATGALDVAERLRERIEQLEVPWATAAMAAAAPATTGRYGSRVTDLASHLRVTVSVGVALLRPAHLNLQALLDDAEDAVAAARQAGGNCVRAAPVELSHLRSPGNPGNPGNWRDGHRA